MANRARAYIEESFEAIDVFITPDDDDSDSSSSSWEVINPSDDDEQDEIYSFDDDDDDDHYRKFKDLDSFGSPSSDLSMQSLPDQNVNRSSQFVDGDGVKDESDGEECDENVSDEDDDLDDELVPKSVNDRFERGRMRKLGKRAYSKMNKSKRLPYYYNRPGCVYGKHGLGLKHSLI